jgi:hypothetical protein
VYLEQNQPTDFDLTCWYLNERRAIELVGVDAVLPQLNRLGVIGADDQLRKNAKLAMLTDALERWLKSQNPPTLGQLLISGTIRAGQVFTLYTNFRCRGLMTVLRAVEVNKTPVSPAVASAKLDDLATGWRIDCRFHSEHLTSPSSWSELSGQRRLLLIGLITGISEKAIEAIPFVIANPISDLGRPKTLIGRHWYNRLEVFADSIDTFEAIRKIPALRDKHVIEVLRSIPEQQVKEAFAEIIGEPIVPKDWGGERSDLLSARVVLEGNRITAAFAFKGPAKFEPMTLAQLGKNGDQIDRLFSEPADLLVLQHCHAITASVRGAMRAYAQQMGNPRLFCLIDGYDTVRLFRAYARCGLTSDAAE